MTITISSPSPRSCGTFFLTHGIPIYVLHLISFIVWIILTAVTLGNWDKIYWRDRIFSITDPSISQPHHSNTINYNTVLFIVFIIPSIIYIIYAILKWYPLYSMKYTSHGRQAYYWVWGHVTSVIATVILTELIKRLVLRFRPDFISRCFPNGIPQTLLINNTRGLLSTADCTGDLTTIHEGRVSFLSGHTSTSFAAALYLMYFFYHMHARKTRYPHTHTQSTYDTTSHHIQIDGDKESILMQGYRDWLSVSGWVTAISFLPLLFATFVGASRCFDNRHHISDVICGAILGIIISIIFAYFNVTNYIYYTEPYHPPSTSNPNHHTIQIHEDEQKTS